MTLIPELPPRRVLVWDMPTRALHWMLATCFTGAFAIALLVRHRSPAFSVHMLLGALAGLVVLLRLVWGLVGTRYARFGSFALGPRALLAYAKSLWNRTPDASAGHNPANAWVALAMLACILGTVITGALIPLVGAKARALHQPFAYASVALVALHIAGIVVHTIRRREGIARAMLDGKKLAHGAAAIRSAHPVIALLFVALVGATARVLVQSYDGATRTLSLPGISPLKMGVGRRAADGDTRSRARRHTG